MKIKKSQLTRELLESYAGQKVKVILMDDFVFEGILELRNGFFYQPKKYVVANMCFRLSRIKSIEV